MENDVLEMLKKARLSPDRVGLYGVFGLRVFEQNKSGWVQTRRIIKKNQITNDGRTSVLNLMCPSTYTAVQEELRIWSIAVGTNNIPPTVSDDATTMSIAWRAAFNFGAGECQVIDNPPNDYLLSISKNLPSTEANGSTLTEAGIYTKGDNTDPLVSLGQQLYARQIHSPIVKTATMTIQYDWQLGITIQG